MKFSIIIPTHNRAKQLTECINSIKNQEKRNFEIIIIDDGSTDKTRIVVAHQDTNKIRYYYQNNKGPASARNLGLKKAKGEIICFTDDDCIVEKDWLTKIEETFDKIRCDATGGCIVNGTDDYTANSQHILNFSLWMPGAKKGYIKDIPTCNIAYKRRSIQGMRFIEQKKGVGYTDTLFNMELIKNNKKIYFNPKIKVTHNNWKYKKDRLKKFFRIQRRAAYGFIKGGYRAHGSIGKTLMAYRWLNLFCPRIISILKRSILHKRFVKVMIHLPLIFVGESYRNLIIAFSRE